MEVLIIIGILFILLELFVIKTEVKKGNKDQQEIKTRLHWLRESVASLAMKRKGAK